MGAIWRHAAVRNPGARSGGPCVPGGSMTPDARRIRELERQVERLVELLVAAGEMLDHGRVKAIGLACRIDRELERYRKGQS